MLMKLADHAGKILAELAYADPRIFVLDGDLADSDGAIHFAQRHPQRFLMAGIAEQNMVSVAAGMAEAGMRPAVFSFAAFLCYRAYDQIRICLSQANQPVMLIGSHAGGLLGRNGKTHAAVNDLAVMLSLPEMQVWAPADWADVELAITHSLLDSAPSYIRLPRRQFEEATHLPGIAAGSRWLRPRQRVCIVSTGLATHWAMAAAELLAGRGLSIGLLHCAQLKPALQWQEELAGADLIVSIEDHSRFGGLGALIDRLHLPAARLTLGWPEEFGGKSGPDDELLDYYGLSPERIAQAIEARVRQPATINHS